jgi:hypothetical protein
MLDRYLYGPYTCPVDTLGLELVNNNLVTDNVLEPTISPNPFIGQELGDTTNFRDWSQTYFGNYIARAPRITIDNSEAAYHRTKRTYKYSWGINVSSKTFGVNFKLKPFDIKMSGEFVWNKKDYKMPGQSGLFRARNSIATYVDFEKKIREKLSVDGSVYYIDGEYDPAMDLTHVSHYFNNSAFYTGLDLDWMDPTDEVPGNTRFPEYLKDYLWYPQHLSNSYHLIDDNDDNDLYAESDLPQYPSDMGTGNAHEKFLLDGSLIPRKNQEKLNYTMLPTGLMFRYPDDNGVISDRFDRNRNGILDYKEDFLLFEADPPVFEFNNDLNNNSNFDVEDDDPYPDLPFQPAYTILGNSFISLGIRGIKTNFRFHPQKNIELVMGCTFEEADDLTLDHSEVQGDNFKQSGHRSLFGDTDNSADGFDDWLSDYRSLVLYGSGLLKVTRRSSGIFYFIGDEIKLIKDHIPNDWMVTVPDEDPQEVWVDYYYKTDELRFRNALQNNVIMGLNFANIQNFVVSSNLLLGVTRRMQLQGRFPATTTFYDDSSRVAQYKYHLSSYDSKTILNTYFITKFRYDITFNNKYTGLLRFLNIFNKLTISPQYKFVGRVAGSPDDNDPRETVYEYDLIQAVSDELLESYKIGFSNYITDNERFVQSVPIIRATYKIAEKTEFQYGYQWRRNYDHVIEERSYMKTSQIAQIVNRDNVAGYGVALILGVKFDNKEYDINRINPILGYGSEFNYKNSEVFVRIYAGN